MIQSATPARRERRKIERTSQPLLPNMYTRVYNPLLLQCAGTYVFTFYEEAMGFSVYHMCARVQTNMQSEWMLCYVVELFIELAIFFPFFLWKMSFVQ